MKLPIDSATRAALRDSIERFGVLVPRLVDQHGKMFDGHQRTELAAELDKPLPPDDTVALPDDPEERERAIMEINDARRQKLTSEQRKAAVSHLHAQGHSERAIAGAVGASQPTVHRDLEARDSYESPATQRTSGLDGKSYPATRRSPVRQKTATDEERIIKLHDQGKSREEIAELTGFGEHAVQIAIRDEKARRKAAADKVKRQANPANGKTTPTRLRELNVQRRMGDNFSEFWRLQVEISKMCGVLESFHTEIKYVALDDENSIFHASMALEDLLGLQVWLDRELAALTSRLREQDIVAKVAKLKDTTGRTPEEAATALRLAKRLERKLSALLEEPRS